MKLEILNRNENIFIQNDIINKIRELIIYKNLEPGDKLPSERVLSEKFNTSRRNVREAIRRLEFYELVKSIPHTGTFIAHIGQIALNGIIENVLSLKEQNFKSLVETRIHLELKAVGLAAERRTDEDLEQIKVKLDNYKSKFIKGEDAFQEDLLFHLAIAKASGNSTLNTLMLQITPKLISVYENNRVCDKGKFIPEINKFVDLVEIKVHQDIFDAIRDKKPQLAIGKMKIHFKMVNLLL